MKKYELLRFNAPLLRKFYSAGIDVSDISKLDVYNEYSEVAKRQSAGVALTVASKRGISERRVQQIVKEMEQDIND
jgi:hypothetical protein